MKKLPVYDFMVKKPPNKITLVEFFSSHPLHSNVIGVSNPRSFQRHPNITLHFNLSTDPPQRLCAQIPVFELSIEIICFFKKRPIKSILGHLLHYVVRDEITKSIVGHNFR